MRILVACEESQRVTAEFRKRGHQAFSCDLVPETGNHPEWHIQGDALEIINGNCSFRTNDGKKHRIKRWDMLIAFPPCTYLTNNGNGWFNIDRYGDKARKRWQDRREAADFFMQFVNADCDKIAIENPVGIMSTWYKKPTQVIHPYQFAESETDSINYVTKRTCLWLKGLPSLEINNLPKPDNGKMFGYYPSGKPKVWCNIIHGSTNRSKTFPGVAKAMVTAWG